MELYRAAVRPLLFACDAEWSHRATMAFCRTLSRSKCVLKMLERQFAVRDGRLETIVAGLKFDSPLGLAAGFDKNGTAVDIVSRLGFGFVEIGSVSERPSGGNRARPRIWRLPADEGLRVYYGCPNDGAAVVAARLEKSRPTVPVGINLVETNTGQLVTAEQAAVELALALTRFAGIADYIVLNLSCPNMPHGPGGLFDEPEELGRLLQCIGRSTRLPPVFLKLKPAGDLQDPRAIDPILQAVDGYAFVKGFILNIPNPDPYATLRTPAAALDRMRGGITGPSLRRPTNAAIGAWYRRIDRKRHVLIGTGGISSAEDAYEIITLGASLVQLYTAMVYRGPGLVRQINDGLCRLLARGGFRNIGEAVGSANIRPGRYFSSRATISTWAE
ncbi:MAG TPA: quinone-dependent dihydroorotate dehydrogenase [Xanthobacteraceae bacterium]|nr:quinone-dependent dihydroorotate dehydrogenase [Xanthobacteraceae bacterium]